MGNSSSSKKEPSRATQQPTSTKTSTFSDIFGSFAFEQKLAPKTPATGDEFPECPICFLNFEGLNEMVCCKGNICSNCYLDIKGNNSKQQACPFCSTASFAVLYKSLPNSPSAAVSAPNSPVSEGANSVRSSPDDSRSNNITKPRSGSLGSSPPSVVFASIKDRNELEQAMRSQRTADRIYAPSSSSSSSSSASSSRNSGPRAYLPRTSGSQPSGGGGGRTRLPRVHMIPDAFADREPAPAPAPAQRGRLVFGGPAQNRGTSGVIEESGRLSSRPARMQVTPQPVTDNLALSPRQRPRDPDGESMQRAGFDPQYWPSPSSRPSANTPARPPNAGPVSPSRQDRRPEPLRNAAAAPNREAADEELDLLQSFINGFEDYVGEDASGEDIEEMLLLQAIKMSLEESFTNHIRPPPAVTAAAAATVSADVSERISSTSTLSDTSRSVSSAVPFTMTGRSLLQPSDSLTSSLEADSPQDVERFFGMATAALAAADGIKANTTTAAAAGSAASLASAVEGQYVTTAVPATISPEDIYFDAQEEELALALSMSLADIATVTQPQPQPQEDDIDTSMSSHHNEMEVVGMQEQAPVVDSTGHGSAASMENAIAIEIRQDINADPAIDSSQESSSVADISSMLPENAATGLASDDHEAQAMLSTSEAVVACPVWSDIETRDETTHVVVESQTFKECSSSPELDGSSNEGSADLVNSTPSEVSPSISIEAINISINISEDATITKEQTMGMGSIESIVTPESTS